jgi:hypothetical protein
MASTAVHSDTSTETFHECGRLVHSGRTQAGIQYLMPPVAGHPGSAANGLSPGGFFDLPWRGASGHPRPLARPEP